MVLQSVALPLAAPALAALTDAAVAGDARRASIAAVLVAVLVVAALTAGHFAHIFYFELGDAAVMRLERDLIALSHDSPGIEHHERPEYADRLQVLRTELNRSGWGSMQALLSAVGLGVALVITGVLLAQLNPWLLLLPLAARAAAGPGPPRGERAGCRARPPPPTDNRRARHLFVLSLDAAAAKELRTCGLGDGGPVAAARGRGTRRPAILWAGEVRADALRAAGQLAFAVAYVAATLLVLRDAVAGQRTVGDVVLVITLASQVNQQVTAAVTILQQLQRAARSMTDLAWMRSLVQAQTVHGASGAGARTCCATASGSTASRSPTPAPTRPCWRASTWCCPPGPASRSSARTAPARRRWSSSCAGSTRRPRARSRWTASTCTTSTPSAGATAPRRASRTSAGSSCSRGRTSASGTCPGSSPTRPCSAPWTARTPPDVLARLEDGLDTQLGTSHADGAQLSGGQWQKLALGRAMMREQPLLVVLDEPTSALDAQAEHDLYERYAAHAKAVGATTGAVTVLVSHRFSTVRMADLILVVADHRIVESGSHEELVALGGLYAELFGIQAAAYL